jgi:hypothetical protein
MKSLIFAGLLAIFGAQTSSAKTLLVADFVFDITEVGFFHVGFDPTRADELEALLGPDWGEISYFDVTALLGPDLVVDGFPFVSSDQRRYRSRVAITTSLDEFGDEILQASCSGILNYVCSLGSGLYNSYIINGPDSFSFRLSGGDHFACCAIRISDRAIRYQDDDSHYATFLGIEWVADGGINLELDVVRSRVHVINGITPVPLPSALATMPVGLFLLVLIRRRFTRQMGKPVGP